MSLTALIIRLIAIFRMKKFINKIYLLFNKINNLLLVDDNSSKTKKNQIFASISLLILFCLPAQLFSNVLFTHKRTFVACLFTLNTYNNFSTACCEYQFILLCFLLRHNFKIVNRKIDMLKEMLTELKPLLLGKKFCLC